MLKTFGTNGFGAVAPRSLGKPAASYPGAVATDSDLTIAVDRQQTRLALPLNATDTSMTVVDPSAIVAYNLLSIDAEIVKTTGPPAGNVVPIARAFDGSASAVHLASAVVSGFVDAYHHNRLAAEVEAIQQTLGPNLSKIPAAPGLNSAAYDFAPQTPGGNLIAGANSITLSPVPQGVSGTNTFHYLYVSGGAGAAEACLIVGGSAVSGAASGTVIIQCANAHSGAWTIRTATAGIQEAVKIAEASPRGNTVQVPGGVTVYAPVRVSQSSVSIAAAAGGVSVVTTRDTSSANVFEFVGTSSSNVINNSLRGLQIEVAPTLSKTGGASVYLQYAFNCHVLETWAQDVPDGVICDNSPLTFIMNSNFRRLQAGAGRGVVWRGSGGPANLHISSCQFEGSSGSQAAAGLFLENGGGIYVDNTDFLWCGNGLYIQPGSGEAVHWVFCGNTSFDASTRGIAIQPAGAGEVLGAFFDNCWTSSHQADGVLINAAGGTVDGVRFANHRSLANGNHGFFVLAGRNVAIHMSTIWGNSTNPSGAYDGIAVAAACTHIDIIGCNFTRPAGYAGAGDTHGSHIAFGAGASDQITIVDNDVSAAVVAAAPKIDMAASGQNIVVRGNRGVPNLVTIASAASINLGTAPADGYAITGTIPIATMSPAWEGRQVYLLFTDAAPGGVVAGGAAPAFRKARTAAPLDLLYCTFINGQWSAVL